MLEKKGERLFSLVLSSKLENTPDCFPVLVFFWPLCLSITKLLQAQVLWQALVRTRLTFKPTNYCSGPPLATSAVSSSFSIPLPYIYALFKAPGPCLKGRQLSFPTSWEICWVMPRAVVQENAIGNPLLGCDSPSLQCIPRVVLTAASALLLPLPFADF